MHPRLFELGPLTVYTYGVLLAAAVPARPAARDGPRRRRAASTPTRVLDLGIYIIISALIGAKLLLLDHRLPDVHGQPARAADARALGRRVLRRPDPRRRRRARATSARSACRSGRRATSSRPASRSATSSAASAASSPAAATASRRRCRGASRSPIRSPPPTSARRSACRCTRRSSTRPAPKLLILGVLLLTERKGRPFAGRTFWLYMLLYAISRFIIEFYRGDERGTVGMFSTSQFISLLLAPLAIAMLVYLSRADERPRPSARGRPRDCHAHHHRSRRRRRRSGSIAFSPRCCPRSRARRSSG